MAQAICPDLMPSVKTVHSQFKKAITLFGKCHNLYNSGVLTDGDINQLGKQMYYTNWHSNNWYLN